MRVQCVHSVHHEKRLEMSKNNHHKNYEERSGKIPHIRKKFALSDAPALGYVGHIRNSALSAAREFGLRAGEHIIREAYSRWPELIDDEINILRNECTIDNGNFEGPEK